MQLRGSMRGIFNLLLFPFYFPVPNGVANLLANIPGDTTDPFLQITSFLDTFLNIIGTGRILNGDGNSNQEKVKVPVYVKRPPLNAVIHFYYYSLVALCESSLERWDCHYCKIIGPVELVRVISNDEFHTKSYIAYDVSRKEIVLVFRAVINLGGTFTPMMMVPQKFGQEEEDIQIHSGFLQCVQSDYDQIVSVLRHMINLHSDCKVVIAGKTGEFSSKFNHSTRRRIL